MSKILVAYASKHGATKEIAERISEVLQKNGLKGEMLPAKKVKSLDGYTSVILGSGVYYGGWRKDATKFLTNHEAALSTMPVWIFSSGPTGEGDPVELLQGWTLPEKMKEIAQRIEPKSIKVFHGSIIPEQLNFFEKWILNNVKSPIGDFRDWEDIGNWAEAIAQDLKA